MLQKEDDLKDEMGGSTAVCCLMRDEKLYCANAGDSRAVACVNGQVGNISIIYFNRLILEDNCYLYKLICSFFSLGNSTVIGSQTIASRRIATNS